MSAISEQRKGELFLFSEVVLWALFPIVIAFSLITLPVLTAFAWSTLFSGCFFALLMLFKGTWREMRNFLLWRYTAWAALFIGILYYGLYFTGMSMTSPGNASLIALFEIFTSFMFFHVLYREHISIEHLVGALCMIIGAVIVFVPSLTTFNYGDLIILCATFFAPVGNLFQQRARMIASSETIMFMRTLLAAPVIFLFAYFFDFTEGVSMSAALPFLVINGILLLGLSKILWIETIHRISVTKANALSAGAGPLLTFIFAWILLSQEPTLWQLVALAPFVAGVFLLTDYVRLSNRSPVITS